jgi:RNase P/RNase MRP subunit p30
MYVDVVLMKKSKDVEVLANKLGFEKLLFEEDFKKLKIVKGKNENSNRAALEEKRNVMLLDPQVVPIKDHLHYRKSGLNQVMCGLANKNDIIIGFSLENLRDPVMKGRVMQNIKLCRKYKAKMAILSLAKDKYSLRGVRDLISFAKTLGMTEPEAKLALSWKLK